MDKLRLPSIPRLRITTLEPIHSRQPQLSQCEDQSLPRQSKSSGSTLIYITTTLTSSLLHDYYLQLVLSCMNCLLVPLMLPTYLIAQADSARDILRPTRKLVLIMPLSRHTRSTNSSCNKLLILLIKPLVTWTAESSCWLGESSPSNHRPVRLRAPALFLHPFCRRYVFVDFPGLLLTVSCKHREGIASTELRRCA